MGLARAGAASVTCTDLPCHIPRIKATVEANTTDASGVGYRRNDSMDTGGSLQGSTTMGRVGDGDGVGSVHVLPLRWGDDIYSIRSVDALSGQAIPVAGRGGAAGASIDHGNGFGGTGAIDMRREGVFGRQAGPAFDLIVLSEVLYWPALDLLVEDTREPLRSTLVELSDPGTVVVLVFKERSVGGLASGRSAPTIVLRETASGEIPTTARLASPTPCFGSGTKGWTSHERQRSRITPGSVPREMRVREMIAVARREPSLMRRGSVTDRAR